MSEPIAEAIHFFIEQFTEGQIQVMDGLPEERLSEALFETDPHLIVPPLGQQVTSFLITR